MAKFNRNNESALVYSTDKGKISDDADQKKSIFQAAPDGVVRIQREVKGRGGKAVCVIYGLSGDETEIKQLLKELKNKCACGGAIKDGTIEIQGDNRDKIRDILTAKGYKIKLAGG